MKSQGFDIISEYFYDTCVKRRWQSLGWLVCPVGSWFLVNQNSLAHSHVNVVRFSNLKFHIKGNSWWLLRSHHTSSKEWWDALCILITTQSSVIWLSFLFKKYSFGICAVLNFPVTAQPWALTLPPLNYHVGHLGWLLPPCLYLFWSKQNCWSFDECAAVPCSAWVCLNKARKAVGFSRNDPCLGLLNTCHDK